MRPLSRVNQFTIKLVSVKGRVRRIRPVVDSIMDEGNIEHRTSNAEHRTRRSQGTECRALPARHSTFDARCSMFDVPRSQASKLLQGKPPPHLLEQPILLAFHS